MNILILGRSVTEKKNIDFDTFLRILSNHKNIKNVKRINIFMSDSRSNKDFVEELDKNDIKIIIRDIGPFQNIHEIMKTHKIKNVDVIINDHSTMKFMHRLVDLEFFKTSKLITNNTVLFLQDMPTESNSINFSNYELLSMLSKLNVCKPLMSIQFISINNKSMIFEICPDWTIREFKALLYYSSFENNFTNRILTQKEISTMKLLFAGKQLKDNMKFSDTLIQNGSTIHQVSTMSPDGGLWPLIKSQIKSRQFKLTKITNDDFILNHPNVKKHIPYVVCKKDTTRRISSLPKK